MEWKIQLSPVPGVGPDLQQQAEQHEAELAARDQQVQQLQYQLAALQEELFAHEANQGALLTASGVPV